MCVCVRERERENENVGRQGRERAVAGFRWLHLRSGPDALVCPGAVH